MDFSHIIDICASFEKTILTIDSHTAGERTRLIVSGVDKIIGKTMVDKLEYFKTNYDQIRCLLTKEPRGHRGVLAAMLTESVNEDSSFGLLYMDAKRYPYLCGHATIGAVATLYKTGHLKLKQGENTVNIDTPSGVMSAVACVSNNEIESVAIQMVPSFVLEKGKIVNVNGFGKIPLDLVCVGGFFAMVSSKSIGRSLDIENKEYLTRLGMDIIDACNEQLQVYHPLRPEVNTVDVVEFYTPSGSSSRKGNNMVIYGESNVDRSPCGTGTAAKLTLLYDKKQIGMNQEYENFSPLGTSFKAAVIQEEKIGDIPGVKVQIKGMAQVTGIHYFVLDQNDPFSNGFMM